MSPNIAKCHLGSKMAPEQERASELERTMRTNVEWLMGVASMLKEQQSNHCDWGGVSLGQGSRWREAERRASRI